MEDIFDFSCDEFVQKFSANETEGISVQKTEVTKNRKTKSKISKPNTNLHWDKSVSEAVKLMHRIIN